MTGNNSSRESSRERPDNEPTPVTDAAADPGVDLAADATDGLDQVLAASADRLLAALQTALDLDAGLAAHFSGVSQGSGSGSSGETGTAASATGGRLGSAFPAARDGELDAVCQLIGGYLSDLEPLADPAGGVPGSTVVSFAAVYRLLDQLRAGLLQRSLDRDSADRLARLAVHNATETRQLLAEERHRTVRPGRRGRIDAWTATATGIRDAVGELRPRIRRLFDGAEDTAPHQPAPRLPV